MGGCTTSKQKNTKQIKVNQSQQSLGNESSAEYDNQSKIRQLNQKKLENYQKQVDRLKNLVSKIVENMVIQEKLTGKDLGYICGQTGIGKSTFLNYYSGQKIMKGEDEKGKNILQLENPSKQVAEIGNTYESTTLHVNHFISNYNYESIYMCDGPGLLDSKGFEGNIINSVITINTIYQASSIRFILMFTPDQYSMQGRAGYIKEVSKQYVQMFQQFERYQDSIILAFNYIAKKDEEKKMAEAIESFESVKDSIFEEEEKQFLDMLINKIKEKHYFLFDYNQNCQDIDEIKNKIHKLTPIKNNLIPQYIKYSIPQSSEGQFNDFLSKCIEALIYCIKNSHPEEASEIVNAFSQLNDNIPWKNVKEQYKKAIEEIKDKESIVEKFQSHFSNFVSMKLYDPALSQNVTSYMRQTLQFYLIVELIHKKTQKELSMKGTIYDIVRYIQQQIYEIYNISKQTSSFEEKYFQVLKLRFILEDKKLKEDYENICAQLSDSKSGFLSDIFNQSNFDLIQEDLQQSCQKLSLDINEIITNQQITDDLKIILKNIQFLHENNNKDKLLKIESSLDYKKIQNMIYQQIQSLANQLSSLKEGSQQKTSQQGRNIEKQYKFIKFICSSQNTDQHFQIPIIQNEFNNLKDTIKQQLVNIYQQGSMMDTTDKISNIQAKLQILQNLDDELYQEVKQSNIAISNFDNNLNLLFEKQKLQFLSNFKKNCDHITAFIENKSQQLLPEKLSKDLKQNLIDLSKLCEIASWFLQNLQSNYRECEAELDNYAAKIEKDIQDNIHNKEKLQENLRLIQVLTTIHLGFAEYKATTYSYQISIQTKQIVFMKAFSRWVKTIFNQHEVPNTQGFTFQELDKLNNSILNVKHYLAFLADFQKSLTSPIQEIYKKIVQRNIEINEMPAQTDAEILNPYQKQNISAICDISFIRQLDEELEKSNNYLRLFKASFNSKFRDTYNFDLERIQELPNRNVVEIRNILDQLMLIFNEDHRQIIELYQFNLYKNAQEVAVNHLQKEMIQILQIDDNKIETRKQRIEELHKFKTTIEKHIPPNIELDFEKEKLKIEADQKRLNQRLTTLLFDDKFKDASELLNTLEVTQKNNFRNIFDTRISQIIKNLTDSVNLFQKDPSLKLQQTILQCYSNLQEAYNNFKNYQLKFERTKIDDQLQLYTERLVSKLFQLLESLKKDNSSDTKYNNNDDFLQYNNIMSITKIYFQNYEIYQIKQVSLIQIFKKNILLKLKDVQKNLECSKLNQIDLSKNIDILIKMHQMVEELDQKDLLNSKEIKQSEQQLKAQFEENLIKQTIEFIHSNYEFNPEEIEEYMRENYGKLWEFFQVSNKNVEKLIHKFIKQQQNVINNITSTIKTQDPKKLQEAANQFQQSRLIHNDIRGQVQSISSNILIECIPQKNFVKAKKLINNLEAINQYFNKKDDPLNIKSSIQEIFQNITNEILSLWTQLEEQNLQQPQKMHSTLYLIERLQIVITDCPLEQIDKQCNELSLITLIMNSFVNKLDEIKQSIENLDYESTTKHYQQLQYAFKEQIVFQKKKRNYIKIFEKLLSSYIDKFQFKNKTQAFKLIEQFSDLKKTFISLLENHQKDLLNLFKRLYQNKEFQKILEKHQIYQQYCRKINQDEEFLKEDGQHLILKQIEKEYEIRFQLAKNIESSKQLKLKELGEISQDLIEIEQLFSQYSKEIRTKMYSLNINAIFEQQIQTMIQNTKELIKQFDSEEIRKVFVKNIIEIYLCSSDLNISSMKTKLQNLIQEATQGQEMDIVLDLLFHLNQDPIGCKLQEENAETFKQWFIQLYNQKTEKQNSFEWIKDKLQTVQGNDESQFSVDELLAQYTLYKTTYEDINLQISQLKIDKSSLTLSILNKAKKFKEQGKYLTESKIVWSVEQKKALLEILAEVSAIWSIIDRQESNSKTSRFIHTIQIITIMRLIAIDQKQGSQVFNHIAQVRTGEGKSIALGITSTIFALIGFQVDCCCYSQYLSDRDFKDFESFFSNFKVEKQIQYNTFSKLTEKIVNYPNDLRTLGENYFSTNQQQIPSVKQNQVKKILIIDEIDFFFGENFLGEVYAVGCQLKSKQVVNLMKLIWNRRYRNITIETIKNTNEYTELFNKNPKLNSMRKFINSKIEKMLSESKQMEKHTYLLKRTQNSVVRKIGYQEIDRISYDIIKGYKTAFAYLQEWQRKKITTEQLEDKLALNFNLGCFSYPKIIECYSLVLGVTGTLQDMTDFQKRKMKELCNIQKQTITPSIFGESKFKFDKKSDVHIFNNKEEYFQTILKQVQEAVAQNRSVIAFFENQKVLFDFKKYSENNGVSNYQILFEQTADKKAVIAKAAYSQTITLSTKPFGRGTDFKCFDKTLLKSGGIHAIQTFLSDTLAEQKQIEGRVARNGEPGSYSLIVLKSDLEICDNNIPSNMDLYDFLDGIRQEKMKEKDKELDIKQKECEIYHDYSMQLKELFNSKFQQIDKINQLLEEIAVYGDSKDNKINKPSQFYNECSEQEMQNAEKDKNGNPKNNNFDLGKDGQYIDKSILIGQFCDADIMINQGIQSDLKKSLQQKGFKEFELVNDEKSFVKLCPKFDQLWVISHKKFISQEQGIEKAFVDAILLHLKQRKGVMIFADNHPFYYHANLLLKQIPIGYQEQNPVYMDLQGNDPACNILKRGVYDKQLEFGKHSITQGLYEIYEGNTICYPKVLNGKGTDTYDDFLDIEIVGTSTTNRPCMFVLNGSNKRGRIVFDCGFTKLMSNYWNTTAGTSRYVQNCYAWLYFMDKDEE